MVAIGGMGGDAIGGLGGIGCSVHCGTNSGAIGDMGGGAVGGMGGGMGG